MRGRKRITGKYKTRAGLIRGVMSLYYHTHDSMRRVAVQCGISPATTFRILEEDCKSPSVRKEWKNDV